MKIGCDIKFCDGCKTHHEKSWFGNFQLNREEIEKLKLVLKNVENSAYLVFCDRSSIFFRTLLNQIHDCQKGKILVCDEKVIF